MASRNNYTGGVSEPLSRPCQRWGTNLVSVTKTPDKKTLVPSKGLEPPHPCGYMDLNHARLPIPPRWQKVIRYGAAIRSAFRREPQLIFYRGILRCQTLELQAPGFRLQILELGCRYPMPAARNSLPFQLSVHRDVRLKHLGYRAAALGILGGLLESSLIGVGYVADHIEMNRGDRPAGIELFHGQCGRRFDARGREIGGSQLPGERHGEASSVCRRNQFFRIRAGSIFESRTERIRSIVQHSAR